MNLSFCSPIRFTALLALAFALPAAQATGFDLGDFAAADWQQVVVTGGAGSSASWSTDPQLGHPGEAWLVSFQVSPSSGPGSTSDRVANFYSGFSYDPGVSGALDTLVFGADLAGFSTSFTFAPLGYVRPAILQNGTVFTVLSSDRTVLTSAYAAQQWSFSAASSWSTADSSGLLPDFSASGAPIQFGLRFTQATNCAAAAGCRGGSTLVGIDNISVALGSVSAVPEPQSWALLLAGAGLLALARGRKT